MLYAGRTWNVALICTSTTEDFSLSDCLLTSNTINGNRSLKLAGLCNQDIHTVRFFAKYSRVIIRSRKLLIREWQIVNDGWIYNCRARKATGSFSFDSIVLYSCIFSYQVWHEQRNFSRSTFPAPAALALKIAPSSAFLTRVIIAWTHTRLCHSHRKIQKCALGVRRMKMYSLMLVFVQGKIDKLQNRYYRLWQPLTLYPYVTTSTCGIRIRRQRLPTTDSDPALSKNRRDILIFQSSL